MGKNQRQVNILTARRSYYNDCNEKYDWDEIELKSFGLNQRPKLEIKETSLPASVPVVEFGLELDDAVCGLRFLEIVAINRGAQVSVFDSADVALAWLIADPNKANEDDGNEPRQIRGVDSQNR